MMFWSIVGVIVLALLVVSWWVGRGRNAPSRMGTRPSDDAGSLQGGVHQTYTNNQPHP